MLLLLLPLRRWAGVRKDGLPGSPVATPVSGGGVVNSREAAIGVDNPMPTEAEVAPAANGAAIFRAAAGSARLNMKK
ncbi:MAG: hypothetical protein Fur0044_36230 [Anaerolineae bacterium]